MGNSIIKPDSHASPQDQEEAAQKADAMLVMQDIERRTIDAMEAGPEMDSMVASAIYAIVAPRDVPHSRIVQTLYRGKPWRPSTDWTDAMFAAERFGLFDCSRRECTLSYDGHKGSRDIGWCIWWDGDEEHGPPVAHGPTGPLTICRAILKLHAGGER